MQTMSYVKRSIITAMCLALSVVLPMAFHAIPNAGSIFCPMHIPVLLCGLTCGAGFGFLCGMLGPLLSSLFTGMPPMVVLPPMTVELALYGLISGLMFNFVRTKRLHTDLYISLLVAMIIGRVFAGIAMALIFFPGNYSIAIWATSYFITCWPGLIIQLVLVPAIIIAAMKAKLIPQRYPIRFLS
jgi:thiamine transporter ThiT